MKMFTRDELMKMTKKELVYLCEIELGKELASSTKSKKSYIVDAIMSFYRACSHGEKFAEMMNR